MFKSIKDKVTDRERDRDRPEGLRKQKKYSEAEDLLRQEVQENKIKFGKDHPITLDKTFWLGSVLYAQNKTGEAVALFRRQTKAANFPDVYLQSRAEYPAWKKHVRELISNAGIFHLLDNYGIADNDDDSRKVKKEDEALRLWTLRQLPEYLSEMLVDSYNSRLLWNDLEGYIQHCPFCGSKASLLQIREAANHGCDGCRLVTEVAQSLKSSDLPDRRSSAPPDIEVSQTVGNFLGGDICVAFTLGVSTKRYYVSHVLVPPGVAASPYLRTSIGRPLCEAFHYLSACLSEHPDCAVPDPMFTPRRLISVGDHYTDPFLVEQGFQNGPYAALSYCWGSSRNTLVTKRQNLHRHFEVIDFALLPKSIKDAIEVCRCLQIPFLWVDAICIVQDDVNEGDWYEQSQQMGAIYSNAHLVLSVDVASHCTEGFLIDTSKKVNWMPLSHRTADDRPVIKITSKGGNVGICKESAGNLRASALSQRGWSMQECMLPQRVLHFAKDEIIWECSTMWTCECGNSSSHGLWKMLTFAKQALSYEDDDTSTHITAFLKGSSQGSICWIWERIIERYSQRLLTIPQDKLPAISGLAKLFQTTLNAAPSDYLAGLWKIDLPMSLLWHVTGFSLPSRPEQWRAPTWSWASLDSGIGFFNERYQFSLESHIEVVNCFCSPSSVDPLGRVKDGMIKILGNLVPVTLKAEIVNFSIPYNGQYVGACGKPPRTHKNLIVTVRNSGKSYEVLPDLRIKAGSYESEYFCLDIGRIYNPLRRGERYTWLVVRKSEKGAGQLTSFQRVGIGIFDSSTERVDLFYEKKTKRTEIILI